jgi:polar amino acid transport system permease protein
VLALMKLSPVAAYRWLATVYIEFFRGLPALVVIIFMALGVPLAFGWTPPGGPLGGGLIGLIMVSSAYMAETLRAGIQAVPKGQAEAARSLGMSGAWTMISVTMPQAIRIVIPPMTNEFVLLIKDTSLLAFVGMQADQVDLTAFGSNNLQSFGNPSPLLAIALVYLAIALPLTRLVAYLEKRTQRAR